MWPVAASADLKLVAVANESVLELWDTVANKKLWTTKVPENHQWDMLRMQFVPGANTSRSR